MEEKKSMLDALKEHFANMTPEQIAEEKALYFPKDKTPKGWVDIEEHLPKCKAMDFIKQGYSVYSVRDKDGDEYESYVTDHNTWYYSAKEQGITHWLNE